MLYNYSGGINMYDYIKGVITGIYSNSIVVDNNGIGYCIRM